jgi:hypothetical protein
MKRPYAIWLAIAIDLVLWGAAIALLICLFRH